MKPGHDGRKVAEVVVAVTTSPVYGGREFFSVFDMLWRRLTLVLGFALVSASALAQGGEQAPAFTPFHANGIYAVGEKVGWTAQLPPPSAGEPQRGYKFVFERNMKEPLASSATVTKDGRATFETAAAEPGMIYVTVEDRNGAKVATLGAAVEPTQLKPTAEKPADFDAFWAAKLKALRAVPMKPVLTPVESPLPGVEEFSLSLNSLNSRVHGYLARPKAAGKHPALLIYQYAGVYAIDPKWAGARAAQGWLTLNVSSHDLPLDQKTGVPPNYQIIGNADRETSYFLEMYLRDTRALDYLTSLPDWDGKVLVLNGASMGGQQSLVTAALNADKVTAVVVNEPAGADALAELHGRKAGYPNWAANDPKVRETAPYFDTVNFASAIRAPVLAAVGFIDTTVTPAGVWTMFNRIPAPKEMVSLVDSDHMHITPSKIAPYTARAEAVLEMLRKGDPFVPNP